MLAVKPNESIAVKSKPNAQAAAFNNRSTPMNIVEEESKLQFASTKSQQTTAIT